MRLGYARVSTLEQNLDRQLIELEDAGVEKIFTDKASGKDTNREQFNEMLEYAREKDTIVVSSLDRLGRNYDDVKEVLEFCKRKNIGVDVLDAPFLNFNTGNESLDKALFDMLTSLLSYISENERTKMLERQRAGIAVAKSKGVYKGKAIEYSADAKDAKKRAIYHSIVRELNEEIPILRIANNHGVSRKLIYRIKNDLVGDK